jgi:RNA polymerase sigma-70 factor, ECF subfamily
MREEPSDAELVAAVRRGDREAAGLLARRYLRACRSVALAITGEEASAEDVCQDAFVVAIDRIADCREPDRFSGWLLQIVRNRARNRVRDAKPRRMLPLESADAPAVGGGSVAGDGWDRGAERAELRDRLLAALKRLPEVRRNVVLLHDLEGWTHREIAERLELPEGTVRSHLHHARRQLRELLGDLRKE